MIEVLTTAKRPMKTLVLAGTKRGCSFSPALTDTIGSCTVRFKLAARLTTPFTIPEAGAFIGLNGCCLIQLRRRRGLFLPDDMVRMPGATQGGIVGDQTLAVEIVKAVVH